MSWTALLPLITKLTDIIFSGFKQKREPGRSMLRKKNFYIPLIEELESKNSHENIHLTQFIFPLLKDIVENSYKYVPPKEIMEKCLSLYKNIQKFNKINSLYIAETIIIDIFTDGYEQIYGSKIDGISYYTNEEGENFEFENLAKPIELIQRRDFKESVKALLDKEGFEDIRIYIEKDIYDYGYTDLINIYESYLGASINQVKIKLPPKREDIKIDAASYIAITWDFFEIYNDDYKIKEKQALFYEIEEEKKVLLELLKRKVSKIVKKHEV